MNYANFDLEFSPSLGDGLLRARVLQSPAGESEYLEISWPFKIGEERQLVRDIFGGLAMRSPSNPDIRRSVESFGGKLFEAVFAGQIDHLYRESLARLTPGERLRLRLRLPDGLLITPWEFLFDRKNREFPAVKDHSAVVRYLPTAKPTDPITVEGPLRLLVAISAPSDHPRLDAGHEWEIICEALRTHIKSGQIALDRVKRPCTFNHLRDALRSGETHVFHFVGHGIPGALIFEGEHGDGVEMDAVRLRSAFPGRNLPRLIVLNSCAGALGDEAAGLSGIAQEFMMQGAPAVLGMQAAITDKAAIHFTRYFYSELVACGAVDAALTEARIRLNGEGNAVEWGIPVLYMRSTNGQLFRPATTLASPGLDFLDECAQGRGTEPRANDNPDTDEPRVTSSHTRTETETETETKTSTPTLDIKIFSTRRNIVGVALIALGLCLAAWFPRIDPNPSPAPPEPTPTEPGPPNVGGEPTPPAPELKCDSSNIDEQAVECLFL